MGVFGTSVPTACLRFGGKLRWLFFCAAPSALRVLGRLEGKRVGKTETALVSLRQEGGNETAVTSTHDDFGRAAPKLSEELSLFPSFFFFFRPRDQKNNEHYAPFVLQHPQE